MIENREQPCECACHYFPGLIRHENPCCDAKELFIKVHGNKNSVSKLSKDDDRWKSGSCHKA
jgi:hypothetical protein